MKTADSITEHLKSDIQLQNRQNKFIGRFQHWKTDNAITMQHINQPGTTPQHPETNHN